MYLIDTNIVSELLRPNPEPAVTRWLDRHGADSGLPTTAIFELRLGAAQLPEGQRRDQLILAIERIVNRFGPRVYGFDRASAEMAGELVGESARRGRVLARMDAQIAGIAAVYGLTLVTRNVGDFASTGLDLHNPWPA
jgi:predicted nucleic acid-binding protein